jgi:peptidoglycan/LPS O-acetylase OafA/YrhL
MGPVLAPVAFMVCLGAVSDLIARSVSLGRTWDVAFPIHAWWFAAGMAVAVASVRPPRQRRYETLLGAATIVVLTLASIKLSTSGELTFVEAQTLMAVASAVLLLLVLRARERSLLRRTLTARPLAIAGAASYGIFLWHDPLLRYLREHGLTLDGRTGFFVNLAVLVAATVVISLVTYEYVEKRALALKRPAVARPELEPAVASVSEAPPAEPAKAPVREGAPSEAATELA